MSSKKAKIKKPENVIASANHALVLFKTLEPIPLLPGGEGRDEGIVPPTSFLHPTNPAPDNAQPTHKKPNATNRCPLSHRMGEGHYPSPVGTGEGGRRPDEGRGDKNKTYGEGEKNKKPTKAGTAQALRSPSPPHSS